MNSRAKYFKLLQDTKIPSFIEPEKVIALRKRVNELSMLRQHALPKHLYRYRTVDEQDHNISALINNEIWGTSANLFNDPLDTQMFFSPIRVKKEYLALCQQAREIETQLLSTRKSLNGSEVADKDYQLIANRKRIPSDDEIEGLIEKSYSKILVDIKTQSYIACFTENLYSSLMWAHYADSHKGFAVEYKAIDLLPEVLPVQYSPKRIDATDLVLYCLACKLSTEYHIHSELKDILLPTKILTNKTIDWKHEKEWRIFKQDPPILDFEKEYKGGYQVILKKSPKAIYLGYRIERKHEEILCNIAREKSIAVYKMRYNTTDLISGGLMSERIV
jgi:hypothetical protein